MNLLPASVGRREKVTLTGGEVEVRGLTMLEVRMCRDRGKRDGENEADIFAVSLGAGVPEADAREWFRTASAGDLQALIDAIFKASGLDEGAGFPGSKSVHAGTVGPDA